MEMKIIFAIALSYFAIVKATPLKSVEADDLESVSAATVHLITTVAENKNIGTIHRINVTAANRTAATMTAANVTAVNTTTAKNTQHHNITVIPITNTAGTVDTSMVTITNAGTINTTMLTNSKIVKRTKSTAVTSTLASTTHEPSISDFGEDYAFGMIVGILVCAIAFILYLCYLLRKNTQYIQM